MGTINRLETDIKHIIENTFSFKSKQYPAIIYHISTDIRSLKLNRILNNNYKPKKNIVFSIHREFNKLGKSQTYLFIHIDTINHLKNKGYYHRDIYYVFTKLVDFSISDVLINTRPQEWYKKNGFF